MIYLPVKLAQRASITDLYVDDDAILGDSVEVIGSINNMGAGTLYNVRARLESKNLGENDTFIGNIEAGKSGSIDILTNAVSTTGSSGEISTVVVTYEDKEGNETELTGKFNIVVESPVYDNVEKIKDNTKDGNSKAVYGICAVAIVLALIVISVVRRRKKKKAILNEF